MIFAAGIRFWALAPAADGPRTSQRNTVSTALAYLCFAAAAIVVIAGILYIAKDFISHTVDIQLFGAKPPKK